MKAIRRAIHLKVIIPLFVFVISFATLEALAVPISFLGGEPFNYRDQRSANTVGFSIGDRNTFGHSSVTPSGDANGDGFSDNPGPPVPPTSGTGTQGGLVANLTYNPTDRFPNLFIVSRAFSLVDPTGNWILDFSNESDTAQVVTPSLNASSVVPFVDNMSCSNCGTTTPTFNWSIPVGSTHNASTIRIFDLDADKLPNGTAPIIFSAFIRNPNQTSFTVPVINPNTGQPALELNRRYSVSIQLDEFVPGSDFTSNDLRNRSRSFFDFVTDPTLPGGSVFLPSIDPDAGPSGGPVYEFTIDVQGGQTIFIDPEVAIGYDYIVDLGPNFASVLIPAPLPGGDDLFDLLVNGSIFPLIAGVQFDLLALNPLGFSNFGIRGIDVSEALDPTNPIAFPTGLTFVSSDTVSMRMIPVTVNVPEPATVMLVGLGLAGLGFARRRRRNA